MKKFLLLLSALLFQLNSFAQLTSIPDGNFEQALIALGLDSGTPDNFVLTVNISGITSLNVSGSGITDLAGIQDFTSLTELNCSQNPLSSLDLTSNTSLTILKCFENTLSNISFIGLTNLTNLTWLDCHGNNFLSLDTNALTNLNYLDCSDNQIYVLSFQYNNLSYLNCYNNNVNTLDYLSTQTNLQYLDCHQNNLPSAPPTQFNLTGLNNLIFLYCASNQLTSLNTAGLTSLQTLYCEQNQLTTLSFSTSLISLRCSDNQLPSLDVSMLGSLTELRCEHNPLLTLVVDPTTNANLTALGYGSTTLNNYDPSPLINLMSIFSYSQTALDLHLLTNLQTTWVLDLSPQTSLDLSALTNMTSCFINLTNLNYLNLKTGNPVSANLQNNGSLTFVCANDSDVAAIIAQSTVGNNPNLQINSYCSFTPGGLYNTVSGVTYFGCSLGNPIINNVKIGINDGINSGATFTNNLGNYNFNVQQPTLTVMPIFDVPSYFIVTPPSQIINITPPFGDPLQNQIVDFCIVANGINPDLEVVIVPIGQARPGFQANYKVIYKNIGNQSIASGSVSLAYDNRATYYYSSPPSAVPTWTYMNLLPLETRVIEVAFNLNAPTAIPPLNGGDHLLFTASIPLTGDVNQLDNTMTYNQTVVNSFDPNDKTCLEGNIIDPTKIGEYLHYNINFENTGTADAINIVIKDVIDTAKFDINTLQLMDASHPVSTRITGNIVEFIFEAINLPPTISFPTLSHGNVSFKIKTLPTLVLGDVVANTANIYFDYNFPIVTNTAISTFAILSSTGFIKDKSIRVYPNPTKNNINVSAKTDIKSIQIFDIQGRILQTVIENKTSTLLDISTKQNGVYFLKVTTKDGSSVEKIIKE